MHRTDGLTRQEPSPGSGPQAPRLWRPKSAGAHTDDPQAASATRRGARRRRCR